MLYESLGRNIFEVDPLATVEQDRERKSELDRQRRRKICVEGQKSLSARAWLMRRGLCSLQALEIAAESWC